MWIGLLAGLLVEGGLCIPRDPDIRVAIHGEGIFPLSRGLYRRHRCRRVALKALGLAKVQLPSAFLGRRECVQVSRWRAILRGVVLRTERTDFSRGLIGGERFTEKFVDLLRGIDLKDVFTVHLLEYPGVSPTSDLLHETPTLPSHL